MRLSKHKKTQRNGKKTVRKLKGGSKRRSTMRGGEPPQSNLVDLRKRLRDAQIKLQSYDKIDTYFEQQIRLSEKFEQNVGLIIDDFNRKKEALSNPLKEQITDRKTYLIKSREITKQFLATTLREIYPTDFGKFTYEFDGIKIVPTDRNQDIYDKLKQVAAKKDSFKNERAKYLKDPKKKTLMGLIAGIQRNITNLESHQKTQNTQKATSSNNLSKTYKTAAKKTKGLIFQSTHGKALKEKSDYIEKYLAEANKKKEEYTSYLSDLEGKIRDAYVILEKAKKVEIKEKDIFIIKAPLKGEPKVQSILDFKGPPINHTFININNNRSIFESAYSFLDELKVKAGDILKQLLDINGKLQALQSQRRATVAKHAPPNRSATLFRIQPSQRLGHGHTESSTTDNESNNADIEKEFTIINNEIGAIYALIGRNGNKEVLARLPKLKEDIEALKAKINKIEFGDKPNFEKHGEKIILMETGIREINEKLHHPSQQNPAGRAHQPDAKPTVITNLSSKLSPEQFNTAISEEVGEKQQPILEKLLTLAAMNNNKKSQLMKEIGDFESFVSRNHQGLVETYIPVIQEWRKQIGPILRTHAAQPTTGYSNWKHTGSLTQLSQAVQSTPAPQKSIRFTVRVPKESGFDDFWDTNYSYDKFIDFCTNITGYDKPKQCATIFETIDTETRVGRYQEIKYIYDRIWGDESIMDKEAAFKVELESFILANPVMHNEYDNKFEILKNNLATGHNLNQRNQELRKWAQRRLKGITPGNQNNAAGLTRRARIILGLEKEEEEEEEQEEN
jgi:hypothetical protein